MPVEIINTATPVLLNLVLALITLLGASGTYFLQKNIQKIKAETNQIKDESTRNTIQTALDRLDDIAGKTVNKIEQTTKKDVLAAIDAGSASPDQLKNLAIDAYTEIVKTLKPDYMQVIQETLGDAQTYIMNLIEQKVETLKSFQGVSLLQSLTPDTADSATRVNPPDAKANAGANVNTEAAKDVPSSNNNANPNANNDPPAPSAAN